MQFNCHINIIVEGKYRALTIRVKPYELPKKPLQIWFLFQATLPLFRLFVDHVQMNQLFTNSDYLDIQLIRVRDNKIRLYLFFTILKLTMSKC